MASATEAPGWLRSLVVAAANELPSNAEYLAHLDVAAADPTLIRLASNENTERPAPRVREALERAYYDANLSPATVPPLRVALAERYANSPHIGVIPGDACGSLEPQALNGTDRLELRVFANEAEGQAVLAARLDNLGKGASGAAVQNLQLMLTPQGQAA